MPELNDPGAIRAISLLLPVFCLAAVLQVVQVTKKQVHAGIVVFCWLISSLFLVNEAAVHFGWWSFHAEGGLIFNTPADLLIGWAVLWLIPIFVPKVHRSLIIAVIVILDLVAMPFCEPVVMLGNNWLIGEALAVAVCFVPTLIITRLFYSGERLIIRALAYSATYALTFLVFIPSIILHMTNDNWSGFLSSGFDSQVFRSLLILTLLPGVSALIEFCKRGDGTPIPYDPPKKLVMSGLYSYVANPMQISCFGAYLFLGLLLENYWVCLGSLAGWCWSMGVAWIDEKQDMAQRYENTWENYRSRVRNWIPRWRPVEPGEFIEDFAKPTVYFSEQCGKCNAVRMWFEGNTPLGINIKAAEDHPTRDLRRMTYDPGDGSGDEDGVAGLMRAIEHIDLRYALISSFVRIPGILQLSQLVVDAVGGGPMTIARHDQSCEVPRL